MTFLCDTNIISELARPRPNSGVVDWRVTPEIAQCAGLMRGNFRKKGISRSQADILIAATAEVHDLILVTRNTLDFEGCNL